MTNDKDDFFKKYKHCAGEEALEIIWKAKQSQAKMLNLWRVKISELSPLKELKNLQVLQVSDTK